MFWLKVLLIPNKVTNLKQNDFALFMASNNPQMGLLDSRCYYLKPLYHLNNKYPENKHLNLKMLLHQEQA